MSFWQRIRDRFRAPVEQTEAPKTPIPVTAVGEAPHFSLRFNECLPIVLQHEGGYVDHARDPGGATNLGISLRYARTRGSMFDLDGDGDVDAADIRLVTPETAAPFYHADFWLPVRGDGVGPGLDLALFDYAVNSGPGRAVRDLQAVLGVKRDGDFGPVTMAALETRRRHDVIAALCARRMAFLRSLPTFGTFGRGWQRRVAEVQAAALRAA